VLVSRLVAGVNAGEGPCLNGASAVMWFERTVGRGFPASCPLEPSQGRESAQVCFSPLSRFELSWVVAGASFRRV